MVLAALLLMPASALADVTLPPALLAKLQGDLRTAEAELATARKTLGTAAIAQRAGASAAARAKDRQRLVHRIADVTPFAVSTHVVDQATTATEVRLSSFDRALASAT